MSRPRVHCIVVGFLLLLAAVGLVPAVASAFTATLSIPDLCANPIDVVLFSLETSNTATSGGGGGGGAGRPTIKPLVVSKAPDDCSPLLFRTVFRGEHIRTATLQVTTGKGGFTIGLTDVLITDLKTEFAKNGTGVSNDVVLESITLDSASLSFTSGGTTVSCSEDTNLCN